MKSAFELAMERMGDGLKQFSRDQKKKIADVESLYKSKIAEAKLNADDSIKKIAGNLEEIDRIRKELSEKISEFEKKCDKEKDKIRNEVSQ